MSVCACTHTHTAACKNLIPVQDFDTGGKAENTPVSFRLPAAKMPRQEVTSVLQFSSSPTPVPGNDPLLLGEEALAEVPSVSTILGPAPCMGG